MKSNGESNWETKSSSPTPSSFSNFFFFGKYWIIHCCEFFFPISIECFGVFGFFFYNFQNSIFDLFLFLDFQFFVAVFYFFFSIPPLDSICFINDFQFGLFGMFWIILFLVGFDVDIFFILICRLKFWAKVMFLYMVLLGFCVCFELPFKSCFQFNSEFYLFSWISVWFTVYIFIVLLIDFDVVLFILIWRLKFWAKFLFLYMVLLGLCMFLS